MVAFLVHASAFACGGFFCSNTQPVDQTAERILFAQDPSTGEVETHVQIFYEGPSEDFAWVVPVPSVPEVFLSTDRLFTDLTATYEPRFPLRHEEVDWCTDPRGYGYGGSGYGGAYYSYADTGAYYSEPTVTVVDEERVGAYETVTLQAETSEGLIDWLQANDFDLPDDLEPALDPYVAGGSYFVAMRLAKEEEDGAIQPIGLRYVSAGISVPIQLTSIAASPDMRLEVYVLGEYRAVPESYLHVQINDAAIDWFGGGDNYEDTVGQAADEAGGHAFATDVVGASELPDDRWYDADYYNLGAVREATSPAEAIDAVQQQFVATAFLQSILETYVPPPTGVDAQTFYNNPDDYSLPPDYSWDPEGLADALDERIVTPLDRAGDLFDAYPTLTRLTSSLDAAEMTVDPVFVFNRDMDQFIPPEREATVRYLCGSGGIKQEADRELELPDGRVIDLPSIEWMQANGTTEYEYLAPLRQNAALIIEQTSGTEPPVVIVDNTEDQTELSTSSPASETGAVRTTRVEGEGCSCSTASPSGALLLGLTAVLARRRRRPASRARG